MTIHDTEQWPSADPTWTAVHDLYRDIHKGIRAELFAVTLSAGAVDPEDRQGRAALADHVVSVADLLTAHAAHEDDLIDPVLSQHLPDLAQQIAADHAILDRRFHSLVDQARSLPHEPDRGRPVLHWLYLDLASFVSAYLEHQDLEERAVMPALERAIGPEAVLEIEQAIVGSIPPDQMAASLAVMLPAMNLEDRVDLLGGMQAGAPAEVFEGVLGLARSVLEPRDHRALADRLGA